MGLIEEIQLYFGTTNLYDVLGIEKSASASDVKKSYKKASLIIHPDRVAEDAKALATKKFQVLSKVHFILSDVDKRAAYDEAGLVDEENTISGDCSSEFWTQYWRNLFPQITKAQIEAFLSEYRGSDEEIQDLKTCYMKYKGDMNHIAEGFIGYKVEDEDRIQEILTDLIERKEIEPFPLFLKESKAKKAARVKRYKREAKEAAKASEDLDAGLLNAISKRTQERESQFNSMIHDLEAKYCKKEPKRKKKN